MTSLPPEDPRESELARQKMALVIAFVAIGLSGILALLVLRRFPLPLRIFIVAGDAIVMSVLWLVVRQKFSGK
ncbi:MAG: hypothetical protein JWM88_1460 [Verrucomicrobia bacterium]|nr:hypothetical protein [Verrucomicrobiota bacterium]